MRIAVMGAGSIGGYFGGMLARAGNDVTLIARGANLQAINDRGLKIVTDDHEFTVHCHATGEPEQVGPVDLVLLTVKTYHNPQAVPTLKPMVGAQTSVLCLQNGIDSYRLAAHGLADENVIPGAAYIEASLEGPGQVRQTGAVVQIVLGEAGGSPSQRCGRIVETLVEAGIPAQLSDDIQKTLWTKFLFIATMAGVTSLSRQTMAELMPRPEWLQVITVCMREIETVGRAHADQRHYLRHANALHTGQPLTAGDRRACTMSDGLELLTNHQQELTMNASGRYISTDHKLRRKYA